MLRKEQNLLPLDRGSSALTYAVVGDFAAHPRIQGGGSSKIATGGLTSALAEVSKQAGDAAVIYAPGYDSDTTNDDLLAEARDTAARSDVVLLFVGLSESIEAEGTTGTASSSRSHIRASSTNWPMRTRTSW